MLGKVRRIDDERRAFETADRIALQGSNGAIVRVAAQIDGSNDGAFLAADHDRIGADLDAAEERQDHVQRSRELHAVASGVGGIREIAHGGGASRRDRQRGRIAEELADAWARQRRPDTGDARGPERGPARRGRSARRRTARRGAARTHAAQVEHDCIRLLEQLQIRNVA